MVVLGGIMKKEENNIEEKVLISMEEYKELLVIKGKYEELKNTKEIIRYIPITYKEHQPTITWTYY